MTMVALIALLIAPPSTPVAATGKWVMNYEPTLCTLSRQFGQGKDAVTFAVVKMPFAERGDFLFQTASARPARVSAGSLVMEPSGRIAPVLIRNATSRDGKRQTSLMTVDADTLAALPTSTGVRVKDSQSRIISAVALDKMPQAMTAMKACEDDLIGTLGIRPEDRAAVATKATPRTQPSSWFGADDYPVGAVIDGATGETRIWWTIGLDGRVADCHVILTSGDARLDQATCAAIQRKARFVPAKNAAGQPVKDWGSQRIRWSMP